MDHEQTLLTICAMRRQEETGYSCCDYFALPYDNNDDEDLLQEQQQQPLSPRNSSCSAAPCDPSCRRIMFQWMVRVVDFFPSMNRESVAYAMSYLDRFLATKAGAKARRNRSDFQLAAISCLYTSVKIHEHSAVSPKFLEQLSRAEYTVRDVELMEMQILQALKWKLSTPTALAFLRQYMDLLPCVMLPLPLQEEAFVLAKFQTEVALGDYKYVSVNASTIAFAALLNALEVLQVDTYSIGWLISEAAHIKRDSHLTHHTLTSLAEDLAHHSAGISQGSPVFVGHEPKKSSSLSSSRSSTGHHSPRTVC